MTSPPATHVLAVASGKGGVGKSTISLNLALALVERGAKVGLLDADFYGPDIPLMVNLTRRRPLRRWTLWQRGAPLELEPVERFGLRIMSVGFLLAEDQPLTWPAQMVDFIGRQLLEEVAWGPLDVLVVDLPPGTADIQQQLLRRLPLSAAVVVVGPQDVAHLDARKVVAMFRDAGVRVLGAVENMSELVCPHCGERVEVFPRVSEERSLAALGVPELGTLPLDPALARAGDTGRPLFVAEPQSPQADAVRALADRVLEALDERPAA